MVTSRHCVDNQTNVCCMLWRGSGGIAYSVPLPFPMDLRAGKRTIPSPIWMYGNKILSFLIIHGKTRGDVRRDRPPFIHSARREHLLYLLLSLDSWIYVVRRSRQAKNAITIKLHFPPVMHSYTCTHTHMHMGVRRISCSKTQAGREPE